MIITPYIDEVKTKVHKAKNKGKTVGFIPTMGFLHEGHASLIKEARKNNDYVVVSIFVNPTQFGPNEDFDAYPRDLDKDLGICMEAGADLVFTPEAEELYPKGYCTYVDVEGELTKKLCGASRPGHFKGVASVVTKLFNIVTPDQAYFGQKDAQQVAVMTRMIMDLNMSVDIVSCPIVRESDGLALSSRNTYLSEVERLDATIISKSLFEAREKIIKGENQASEIKAFIEERIQTVSYAQIDYVEIVDGLTLEKMDVIKGDILIAVAVKFGKPRLIDNIRMVV